MTVPFLDLNALHKPLREEFLARIAEIIDSGEFVLGSAVDEFEEQFALYCGADSAVGVNTGTSALHLALLACGVGPGDEVITTPSTFVATVSAIVYTGATPVFVDTDPRTWTIDVTKVEAAVTKKTKAILPVHLHGRMAEMGTLKEIAARRGLFLIEDACQAHGAKRDGITAGVYGDVGTFSFYPGKNLGALGEGGAVVTKNANIAKKVKLLRNWGSEVRYQHDEHAFNYRMDGFQGAVLGVKLRFLDQWTEARRKIARQYNQKFDELGVTRPSDDVGRHVYHIYAILVADRDRVISDLANLGVQCAIHYPIPVHLQRAYQYLGYRVGDFPVAERLAQQWLSLPMDPNLSEAHVEQVASSLAKVV